MGAGGAPEPPLGARRRSGVPWLFCSTLTYPFRSDGGVVCRAHSGASRSHWVSTRLQEEPLASARSERAVRSSPDFLYDPRASFLLRRRGCFAEPPRVRTGVARSRQDCRKSPLASAWDKRSIGGSPGFFVRPSRFLFARKEGWNVPGYPRWTRALALLVSCYRVSPSGGPCPIR